MEKWKAIHGYDGYEASSSGRVRSIDRIVIDKNGIKRKLQGKILKPRKNKPGYLLVTLYPRHRTFLVHALILTAFVGPKPPGMECCHNDGDRFNNYPSNLRWDTKSSNVIDCVNHGRHNHVKLTPDDVRQIRALKGEIKRADIAKKFSVKSPTISNIFNGRSWSRLL